MAALAFPQSPSPNDIFTSAGRSWKWTGTRWQVMPVTISPSRLSGEGAEVGDIMTWDGEAWSPLPLTSDNYLVQSAFSSPYSYIGRAPTGTATTSSGWDITRIEVASDGSTTTLNATGAWTNRASLTYS
jgi:hypothetical protein